MNKFLKKSITGEFGIWLALLHWIGWYIAGVFLLFFIDSIFPPSAELFYFSVLLFVAVSFWFTLAAIMSGYRKIKNPEATLLDRAIGFSFIIVFVYVAYLLYSDMEKFL